MTDAEQSALAAGGPSGVHSFLGFIFRRKRLIISVFLGVVAVVTVLSHVLPPVYESTSKLLVERDLGSDKALLFRVNIPSAYEKYNWIQSEVQIIASYPVAASVIKQFGLEKFTDENPDKLNEQERNVLFKETVEAFLKHLDVSNRTNSNIIEVSFESKNPELAPDVVNQVIQTYIEHRAAIRNSSNNYEFLENQLKVVEDKLSKLERRKATFQYKNEVVEPETQLKILLSKLADFEKSLTVVRTKRIGKEAKLSVIMQRGEGDSAINFPSTEVSDSPSREKYIARRKGELLQMEMSRDRLLQRFKPTYEKIVELDGDIAATKQRIKAEIGQIIEQEKTAIKALQAEEAALRSSIAEIHRQIKDTAQTEYELAQISRGIDDNRDVYSTLLKQRESARLALARTGKGIKTMIISPAIVPLKPVRPNLPLNIFLAIVLGLVAGLGLAWIMDVYDTSIINAEEWTYLAGVRTFGSIPAAKSDGAERLIEGHTESLPSEHLPEGGR